MYPWMERCPPRCSVDLCSVCVLGTKGSSTGCNHVAAEIDVSSAGSACRSCLEIGCKASTRCHKEYRINQIICSSSQM